MKPSRKIINMDYRHQTAVTRGLFAEGPWPRDDETLVHNLHRGDKRVGFSREQRINDAPVYTTDHIDMNTYNSHEGRKCW